MELSNKNLSFLCELAIAAAKKAGKLISEYPKTQLRIENKSGGNTRASQVVTEVDLLCQKIILETLRPTFKEYDLALLTEESPDDLSRLEKDFFWCIDPLDGTLPFIESTSGYSVSIALISRSGVSHIGVIFDPVKQILYHAIKGFGAFRNELIWNLDRNQKSSTSSLSFITDKSFLQNINFNVIEKELKKIAIELGKTDLNIIKQGGAVMNACWALENSPAIYLKLPKTEKGGGSIWDYAATTCLFKELGAFSGDILGKELNLNNAESTFLNHCGIIFSSNKELAIRMIDFFHKKIND